MIKLVDIHNVFGDLSLITHHGRIIPLDYEEMKKERDEAKCQVLELTNNIENIKCGFKRMFQHVLGEESLQEVLKEMKE